MDLAGAVVAITGGARGIGFETAALLLSRGARVAIGDLDEVRLKQAAGELGVSTYRRLDVADPDSFAGFLDLVEAELGPVDVLVNNAGIMPVGRVTEMDDAVTRRMVDVNLLGVVWGTKQALLRMVPRGHGQIVNVGSLAGETPPPGIAAYAGTKAAVNAFTEAARLEYAGTGVRLSAVLPTFTNTELVAGTKGSRGLRNAEPREVAEAVARLVERPRPVARVTRAAGTLVLTSRVMPKAAVGALGRAFGLRQAFLDHVDQAERRAYDERIRRG